MPAGHLIWYPFCRQRDLPFTERSSARCARRLLYGGLGYSPQHSPKNQLVQWEERIPIGPAEQTHRIKDCGLTDGC